MAKKDEWTVKEELFDSRTGITFNYDALDESGLRKFDETAERRSLNAIGYRRVEPAAAV